MQLLIIILALTIANPILCDEEFTRTYKLATEWVYPDNAYIGEILAINKHENAEYISPNRETPKHRICFDCLWAGAREVYST